jgi:hypothetical protein
MVQLTQKVELDRNFVLLLQYLHMHLLHEIFTSIECEVCNYLLIFEKNPFLE